MKEKASWPLICLEMRRTFNAEIITDSNKVGQEAKGNRTR
jgi:hypothetical protein